jgi:hypothetical protein
MTLENASVYHGGDFGRTWPTPAAAPSPDVKVQVTAADTTTDCLNSKVAVAGGGIAKAVLNPGANEQLQLTVAAPVVSPDVKVKVDAADTTTDYLDAKLVAGAAGGEITKSILNPAGNEQIKLLPAMKTRDLAMNSAWSLYTATGTVPYFGTADFGLDKQYHVINFPAQGAGKYGSAMCSIAFPENWDQSDIRLRFYYNRSVYDANNFSFWVTIFALGDNTALNPGAVFVNKTVNTSAMVANRLYIAPEWTFPVQIQQPQGGLLCVKIERGNDAAAGVMCLYNVRLRYGVI